MNQVQWDFCLQMGFKTARDPDFWHPMGRAFYANLSPLWDGIRLLHMLEWSRIVPQGRIALLTAAMGNPGTIDGKRDWVQTHLPEYLPRLFTGAQKELFAGPEKVLIDDNTENVAKFIAAGGQGVLIPRPWNTRCEECNEEGWFSPEQLIEEVRGAVSRSVRLAA